MAVVCETINKRVDQYFEASKAANALGKRLLRNDAFPASIASLVQTQTMDVITNQQRVNIFRSTSMATNAKNDAAVATEANIVSKPKLERIWKVLLRGATKTVSHAESATVVAGAPAKTETKSLGSQTLQCR